MLHANPAVTADRLERLRLFFSQGHSALLAQLVMGGFLLCLAWMNMGLEALPYVIAWFGLLLGVSLGRLWLIRVHREGMASAAPAEVRRVEILHTRLPGLSGLCWGVVPWFAWQGDNAVMDYLAAAMVFGMAGSATATLAALSGAFAWFVWPAVLPYGVKALMIGGDIYVTATVIMLFGIVALTHFNRTVHRMIVESIRLRRENADLVARLSQEKEVVEEALRVKSLFLAGVSHDLKHPLNALGLYLGYLKAQPEGVARALPGMEQALGDMGNQLSRLLELSRLESGAVQPQWQAVDLSGLVAAVCRTAAPEAAARGLRLACRVAGGVTVQADARMLRSVVDNLVANAVRYTERGGVLVALRRGAASWRIEVWDSGPGIPAARLSMIFEAYRRFDDRQRASGAGYGLGLALARRQCDLLGYRIGVASRPGRGSVFRVELPAPPSPG